MTEAFQTFEHTADIGLRAFGATLAEAFANAARGMLSLVVDSRTVRATSCLHLEITSVDQPALLMDWLNELLYRFDAEQFLFKKCVISELSETYLAADCWGEKADLNRHKLKRGIKAATFHALKIESVTHGYKIEVILDV